MLPKFPLRSPENTLTFWTVPLASAMSRCAAQLKGVGGIAPGPFPTSLKLMPVTTEPVWLYKADSKNVLLFVSVNVIRQLPLGSTSLPCGFVGLLAVPPQPTAHNA